MHKGGLCCHPVSVRPSVTLVYLNKSNAGPPLLNGRCTSLLRVVVSEMTYTVSSGTLNPSIPYLTAEDIAKLLSPPGSPITLVFDPGADTQFQGEPLQCGRKIHWGGKNCDFRPKSPFISDTVRDRPMVATEHL